MLQNSEAITLARRMAENEIVCACDALTVPDALGALTEIQAQILADNDITPDTAAFESYCMMMFATLAGRVHALHAEKDGLAALDGGGASSVEVEPAAGRGRWLSWGWRVLR